LRVDFLVEVTCKIEGLELHSSGFNLILLTSTSLLKMIPKESSALERIYWPMQN